jgi:hypothetical protein
MGRGKSSASLALIDAAARTMRGTLAPVLDAYGVTFRVLHGYALATAVYQAVQEAAAGATPCTALYVGDWDPIRFAWYAGRMAPLVREVPRLRGGAAGNSTRSRP